MIKQTNERLTITLSKTKIDQLKQICKENEITPSEFISLLIYGYQNFNVIKKEINEGIKIKKALSN